jgi:hypothetical protein
VAGEQPSWSFGKQAVLMLLGFFPTFLAGVSTGRALGDWPIGLRLLAIVGAGFGAGGTGLLLAWVLFRKRAAEPTDEAGRRIRSRA